MATFRAALLLFTYVLLFVLATPGVDSLAKKAMTTRGERAAMYKAYPPWLAELGLWVVDVNREVRGPVIAVVSVIEDPLRLDQDWGVFRDGPTRYQRLEIRVDGRLVYRTIDPEHDWRAHQLRNRRIRPLADTFVGGLGDSRHEVGFARWLCDAARQDFPDAEKVAIEALWGPFPGDQLTVHHRVTCAGPDWRLVPG